MKKHIAISVIAAALLLSGLAFMLFLNASLAGTEPSGSESTGTFGPADTTEPPVTQPPETEPPVTEPPVTEPPEPETWDPADIGLKTKYAFVYSCREDRVLYAGGDQQAHVAPASLTKLLTAYVALEYLDLDKVIEVGYEIQRIDPNSSVAFLAAGHRLPTEMLIQGLLMQSGNAAAYTLAVAAGRAIAGDSSISNSYAIDLFMKEMNKTAQELGMKNTHFVNPDGIDTYGHYTTMEDLVILSKVSMENPIIMRYCGMAKATVQFVSGHTCTWENSNYLLTTKYGYYAPTAIGLKTGTTTGAGKCLISVFDDGEEQLIIAVLGCPDDDSRYGDTLYLYQKYTEG